MPLFCKEKREKAALVIQKWWLKTRREKAARVIQKWWLDETKTGHLEPCWHCENSGGNCGCGGRGDEWVMVTRRVLRSM